MTLPFTQNEDLFAELGDWGALQFLDVSEMGWGFFNRVIGRFGTKCRWDRFELKFWFGGTMGWYCVFYLGFEIECGKF